MCHIPSRTYPASEWETQMQVQKSSDGSHIPADSQPSLCLKQNRLLKDWSSGIKIKNMV